MAITDMAWAKGMAELVACCSSADLTPEMATVRGNCYREDLAHLSDEQWLYAVKVARQRKWFPAIAELQQYASELPPAETAGLLPEHRVSREEFRRGYEEFKRELDARGIRLDQVGLTLGKATTETVAPPAPPSEAIETVAPHKGQED